MVSTVSILIPCHNGERYLAAAIESALAQTCATDVIVVDDGSTDGSAAIMDRFAARGVYPVRQANRGAAAARNVALGRATGEWCVFLDADDAFERDFLAAQRLAGEVAKADIVFGGFLMTWQDGRSEKRKAMPAGASTDEALSTVLGAGWYPPNAILWRTTFLQHLGGWDETVTRNDDGELIARALLRRPRITSNATSHAVYRQHASAGRVSAAKDERAIASNFRIGQSIAAGIARDGDLPLAQQQLAASMFELAAEAHVARHHALGREIEALAQGLGACPPSGTLMHRLGTKLLGMEGKAKVAAQVRALKRGVSRHDA